MQTRHMFMFSSLSLVLVGIVSCSSFQKKSTWSERNPSNVENFDKSYVNKILKSASAELEVTSSRLLIDNDAAFDAKLDALKNAKSGETIRMIYYIYSDAATPDVTTSVFSKELLSAANRGVKVKLLLDYFTNYRIMDHLHYLENASNGNIQVRLYGRPTDLILRDIYFMTSPCPKASDKPSSKDCASYKWDKYNTEVARQGKPNEFVDYYSSLMAAGIYSKAGSLLKTGLFMGSEFDMAAAKSGTTDPKQAEAFKDLVKLVYDAKIKGDAMAYLKLSVAMVLYASEINPALNTIFGLLPIEQMDNTNSTEHWEHLTDFMHQKLILVGDRYLQLGGRNIADSYHMKQNKLSQKYTFLDTDIEANLASGGSDVAKAFDRLWNFEALSADLKTIERIMPFEFVANHEILVDAAQACAKQPDRNQRAECITKSLRSHKSYISVQKRMAFQAANLDKQVSIYNKSYLPQKKYTESFRGNNYQAMKPYNDALVGADINSAFVAYLENVNYYPKRPTERVFGGHVGKENAEGKMIHAAWVNSLEQTCKAAKKEKELKRVIFHSAYWLPPANLLKAFASMINGDWDCKNVKVTIISNSFQTTDLNVINVFAKYQMKAFFDVYDQKQKAYGPKVKNRAAQFEYFEYLKPANASESQVKSLHTKLTLMGDAILVGSANADVRSFYMDANNGLLIYGATEFNEAYTKWIDSITSDKKLTQNVTRSFMLPLKTLNAYDAQFMDALRARFQFLQKIPVKSYGDLKAAQQQIANELYRSTMALLTDGAIEQMELVKWRFGQDTDSDYRRVRQRIEKEFNRSFMLF